MSAIASGASTPPLEEPGSPVFDIAESSPGGPEAMKTDEKLSQHSNGTASSPKEARSRRAAKPKSFPDESTSASSKGKRGRKKKSDRGDLSEGELATIEAQFASLADAPPPTSSASSLPVVADSNGSAKKSPKAHKVVAQLFDDGADDDDLDADPEAVAEDSDEDAEEVVRERRKNAKKKSTPARANSALKSSAEATKSSSSGSALSESVTTRRVKRAADAAQFDAEAIRQLAKTHPDSYFSYGANSFDGGIRRVNRDHPLVLRPTAISHPGHVYSLNLSADGALLCTASALGSIRIWDTTDWSLLNELRDEEEVHIEEFYSAQFTPDGKKVIAAGKLKQREKWSEEDEDNEITPAPIKIFDAVSGRVVARLEGHLEEILCVKRLQYRGEPYLLSCGQDGRIFKWPMKADYSGLAPKGEKHMFNDDNSNMVFSLAVVPNCGSRYFLGACDDGLNLYDFETLQVVQSFPQLYTCFCDCVKFILPDELPAEPNSCYLVSRGVENLRDDDPSKSIRPNRCQLHRLRFPTSPTGPWTLEAVTTYQHTNYFSNMWPLKIASNGRYVATGTTFGEVFVWNLRSAELVGILADHEECEVRDVLFHPLKPWLLTCAGDSTVKVYTAS